MLKKVNIDFIVNCIVGVVVLSGLIMIVFTSSMKTENNLKIFEQQLNQEKNIKQLVSRAK